jgi:ribonuclease E
MKKEMLINVLQPEECRIAIVEDGVLEELYVERTSQESYVGNIYKGRIVNIEPSIQAAFVDFGIGRNGFLHVSDVEPAYYRHLESRRSDNGNGRRSPRDRGRGRDHDRGRSRPSGRRPPEEIEEPLPEAGPVADEPAVDQELLDALAAEPETAAEETGRQGRSGRERSRSRGRSRRKPREVEGVEEAPATRSEEPETPPATAEEAAVEPPPAVAEEPSAPDDDRPRYMGSAERRTEADAEPHSREETSSAISDDDLLFFPRSQPAPAPSPPAAEPEPAFEEPAPRAISEEPPSLFAEEPPLQEEPEAAAEAEDTIRETPAAEQNWDEEEGLYTDQEEEPAAAETARDESLDEFDEDEFDYRPQRRPQRDDHDRRDRRDRRGRSPHRRMSGRPGAGRPKPLIQDIFKRGQEVLVQVIKEGIGTKGPTLSTYISIAGRYLVLMPGLNRVGVSRKIADDEQRRRLREIFHELQPPKGLGFIIRTAGLDKTKKELQRDLAYLSRLWQVVVRRIKKLKSPAEIYQESDMITRTIRDTFTADIDTIWVDETTAFEHAQEFLQIVMPRYASRIKHYTDSEPLFHKYGIEEEIARIQQRHVPLPMGGSIVIDQTEALVAIDVNSGNFRADNNAEETAYQMNLLAAREIARQLRLRDLGGVIVNDFIDMRDEKHRRDVERALRDAVKRDRARSKILKISQFGLIEMTRQRIRPSLKRSVYQDCSHCRGTGQVKTCESMSIDVMRLLQLAAHRENIHRIQARVHEDVASYLLNRKRKEISRLEESGELQVTISAAAGVSPELLELTCFDNNNNEIKFLTYEDTRPRRR